MRIEDLSGECVVSHHARDPLAFEMCAFDMGMWGLHGGLRAFMHHDCFMCGAGQGGIAWTCAGAMAGRRRGMRISCHLSASASPG